MDVKTRIRQWWSVLSVALLLVPASLLAQEPASEPVPSGDAPPGAPRSRLTLSGLFEVDSYLQKNFFLGARGGALGRGEMDAFWTQSLTLRPRFILSDRLNVNLSLDLAHGVWGIDYSAPATEALATWNPGKNDFLDLRVDWAYLAYRSQRTSSRWYLGKQPFHAGHLLVLDENSPGLLVYRDLGKSAAFGFGFAKESEAGSIGDYRGSAAGAADGRDADLLMLEARLGKTQRGFFLNPFLLRFLDRSNADSTTFLPDGRELGARFHPNISRATVLGVSGDYASGRLRLDFEWDYLKGSDRVANVNSGPLGLHDVNTGELKGMNVYGRLALSGSRLDLSATVTRGSGDPDPFRDEGNINSLRTLGRFSITEVWANGLALDEVGLAPQGLANPAVRGYRGLENTTALQGALTVKFSPSFQVGGSYTILRATEALGPWRDANGDGAISREEYGRDGAGHLLSAKDLGSEIDGRIDWTLQDAVTLSFRGGFFLTGTAAAYLINGNSAILEKPFGLRLSVAVPISEFSLGG